MIGKMVQVNGEKEVMTVLPRVVLLLRLRREIAVGTKTSGGSKRRRGSKVGPVQRKK